MKTLETEILVIGAGPAGLAAALEAVTLGKNVLLCDRDDEPGGVLNQCIHNGFGLKYYGRELTGPEYAQGETDKARSAGVKMLLHLAVLKIAKTDSGFSVLACSPKQGICTINSKAVILAMGCRERTRGNIRIPGSRPAGVMTAGLAQRLVNIEGYLPGKEVVILGSGDIGLIMARRMTLEGAIVRAVIEIQSYPNGLPRNITQCLDDFSIPLYLSHTVTQIKGHRRISSVVVQSVDGSGRGFELPCDTLLLSVGLIPENELSLCAGVVLHPVTRGPVVDEIGMTNVEGIFACGNVLHVHDLADMVSEEAALTARSCCAWLCGKKESSSIALTAGRNIRYVLPASCSGKRDVVLKFRSAIPAVLCSVSVEQDGKKIASFKRPALHPALMEQLILKKENITGAGSISLHLEET